MRGGCRLWRRSMQGDAQTGGHGWQSMRGSPLLPDVFETWDDIVLRPEWAHEFRTRQSVSTEGERTPHMSG